MTNNEKVKKYKNYAIMVISDQANVLPGIFFWCHESVQIL